MSTNIYPKNENPLVKNMRTEALNNVSQALRKEQYSGADICDLVEGELRNVIDTGGGNYTQRVAATKLNTKQPVLGKFLPLSRTVMFRFEKYTYDSNYSGSPYQNNLIHWWDCRITTTAGAFILRLWFHFVHDTFNAPYNYQVPVSYYIDYYWLGSWYAIKQDWYSSYGDSPVNLESNTASFIFGFADDGYNNLKGIVRFKFNDLEYAIPGTFDFTGYNLDYAPVLLQYWTASTGDDYHYRSYPALMLRELD